MSIITTAEAFAHLRLVGTDYPLAQVLPYLEAAESAAQEFLNRRVFANDGALASARAALPAALAAAASARDSAFEQAAAATDCEVAELLRQGALASWTEALQAAEAIARGMVLVPDVRAGMLLTLGHLFENRAEVVTGAAATQIPQGAQTLLLPHRVGWGG
jgi:hypothetical protein